MQYSIRPLRTPSEFQLAERRSGDYAVDLLAEGILYCVLDLSERKTKGSKFLGLDGKPLSITLDHVADTPFVPAVNEQIVDFVYSVTGCAEWVMPQIRQAWYQEHKGTPLMRFNRMAPDAGEDVQGYALSDLRRAMEVVSANKPYGDITLRSAQENNGVAALIIDPITFFEHYKRHNPPAQTAAYRRK